MTSSMSDGLPVNPTTSVKPTLKTIFRYGYLAAFNAHDGDTLMSYVSPNIKVSRLFSPLSPHTDSLRGSCDTHCTLVSVTKGGPTRRDSSQTGIAIILCGPNVATSSQGVYRVNERTIFAGCIPLVEFLVKKSDCECDCHPTRLAEHTHHRSIQ